MVSLSNAENGELMPSLEKHQELPQGTAEHSTCHKPAKVAGDFPGVTASQAAEVINPFLQLL